jgi:hypothetical protein
MVGKAIMRSCTAEVAIEIIWAIKKKFTTASALMRVFKKKRCYIGYLRWVCMIELYDKPHQGMTA